MRNVKLGVGGVLLLVGLFFAYRGVDLNKQVSIATDSMARSRANLLTKCNPLVAAAPVRSLEGLMSMDGHTDLDGSCARALMGDGDVASSCSNAPGTASLGAGARVLIDGLRDYDCSNALSMEWSIMQSNQSTLEAYDSLRFICMAIGAFGILAGGGLLAATLRAKPANAPAAPPAA